MPGLSEPPALTLTPRAWKSGAVWLASATPEQVEAFLGDLSDNALLALPWMFEFWRCRISCRQRGVEDLGHSGRSRRGKTRAGSEWVRAEVEGATPEAPGRVLWQLVGKPLIQVRG